MKGYGEACLGVGYCTRIDAGWHSFLVKLGRGATRDPFTLATMKHNFPRPHRPD